MPHKTIHPPTTAVGAVKFAQETAISGWQTIVVSLIAELFSRLSVANRVKVN